MAFVEVYKNYANFDISMISVNKYYGTSSSSSITIDNKKIDTTIYRYTYENAEERIASTSYIPTSTRLIMCSLKGANGRYLIFTTQYINNQCRMIIAYSTENSFDNAKNIVLTNVNQQHNPQYYSVNINSNGVYFLRSGYDDGEYENTGIGVSWASLKTLYGETFDIVGKVSETFGNASASGGYSNPTFDNTSDLIQIPNAPSVGVSNVGFVNVYKTSLNSLQNLGAELFPNLNPFDDVPQTESTSQAVVDGFNNFVRMLANIGDSLINSRLIDYVIDCHVLPVSPSIGESEAIKIGFKTFEINANKVTSDYIDFDCGSLSIGEYYSNFIDYVGTRAKLYLPFIGYVPLQNEYFQNGVLNVKYRFNIIDGSFMCYVLATSSKSALTNSVIGMYGGNACVHIPITGLNYSSMISGLVNGGASIIANATSGNIGGALSSAINTISQKPQMQSSNSYNSTSAFLGIRTPYLIIEREVSNFSEYYTSENGLPCNITKTISELSGFVQMDNCHMDTLSATEEEKNMIQELLLSGIIV